MSRDPAWTAHEVKLLREVQHMSQRAIAKRLGYAQSTVANWKKPDRDNVLHYETLKVLNQELDGLTLRYVTGSTTSSIPRLAGWARAQQGARRTTANIIRPQPAARSPQPAAPAPPEDRSSRPIARWCDKSPCPTAAVSAELNVARIRVTVDGANYPF